MSLRHQQQTLAQRGAAALAVALAVCTCACWVPETHAESPQRANASRPALRLDADDSSFGSLAGWTGGFDTWRKQFEHTKALAKARPHAGLVFLGDSLTQNWGPVGGREARGAGEPVWSGAEHNYNQYDALNLGIAGDQTQNVLYRIEHGQLDGLAPRLVVLMIGTNNRFAPTGDPGFPAADYAPPAHTPEEIAAGVQAIIEQIRARLPQSHVLTLGVIRGTSDEDPDRIAAARVNALLSHAIATGDDKRSHFLDLTPLLQQTPGAVEGDGIHLTEAGYEVWAKAIAPWVEQHATPASHNHSAIFSKN